MIPAKTLVVTENNSKRVQSLSNSKKQQGLFLKNKQQVPFISLMRAKEKSTPQKVKGNETWSWLSDIFSFPGEDVCLIENETCLASPPYIVQLIHYTPLYIQFQGSGYIVGCIPRSLIPS